MSEAIRYHIENRLRKQSDTRHNELEKPNIDVADMDESIGRTQQDADNEPKPVVS